MRLWPWRQDIRNSDGNPYLTRWRLFPANRWCNVHLHRFDSPDKLNLGLHDHPYDFLAVTLRGTGLEVTRLGDVKPVGGKLAFRTLPIYEPLKRVRTYRAEDTHAIIEVDGLWTLVVHGPRRRTWGFWRDGIFTPHTAYFGE